MDLGTKIKNLRLKENLTQSELAKKANISRVALGQYERNQREPSWKILKNIASSLNVSITYLTDDIEEADLKKIIINDIDAHTKFFTDEKSKSLVAKSIALFNSENEYLTTEKIKELINENINGGLPLDVSAMKPSDLEKIEEIRNFNIQKDKDMAYLGLSIPQYLFDVILEFTHNSTNKNIDASNITQDEKKEVINKIVDLFEFEVFKLSKK